MSTSKDATKTREATKANVGVGVSGPPSFIRYTLTDDELRGAKAAAESLDNVEEVIDQLVGEGYKFSVSTDNYGGGIQCFITPTKRDHPNGGFTLSARAPTLTLALGVLAYKHYTIFSQSWPKDTAGAKGAPWA